jgi:excisionase family DNA binding protein
MFVPKKKRARRASAYAPIASERLAYSTKEVASLLGVSHHHVKNEVARGSLPSFLCGARRLVRRADLDKYMRPQG